MESNNKSVRAIFFDLDNTLIDTAGAGRVAMQKVSRLLRVALSGRGDTDTAVGQICDAFKEKLLRERFDASGGQSIDEVRVGHWEESIQSVVEGSCPASSSGCPSSLASECYYLWKHSRLEQLCLSPEILSLLRDLRSRYKLLLLTNGEAGTQREKVVAVKHCEELFDAVVVGGEHIEEKPCVSIFAHCFALLGVEPHDCVMVGDSLDTDVQGGFNAGVRATVWIDNNRGGCLPDCGARPDYTITSVLDLPGVLSDLQGVTEAVV